MMQYFCMTTKAPTLTKRKGLFSTEDACNINNIQMLTDKIYVRKIQENKEGK